MQHDKKLAEEAKAKAIEEATRRRLRIREAGWRKFEQEQARRERFRLLRLGRILPQSKVRPQLLVRDDAVKGGWRPLIGHNGGPPLESVHG